MHSSVTDRDKQTWKNNQRPANSQICKDTQLNNINRGFSLNLGPCMVMGNGGMRHSISELLEAVYTKP